MNKDLSSWIDQILDQNIPQEVTAFCFNLYEESDESYAMEVVGTECFDEENEDWACSELTNFGSRDDMFILEKDCDWEEALEYMVGELNIYLESGKHADLLKSKNGVGVGFVDGNIEILYTK